VIDPSGTPQFTGDFEQLGKDVSGLRKDAIGIRNNGSDIHSRFQMLEAFYVAPEADDLFATTQPVVDRADGFATKLETVTDALDTYSAEAAPPAKRLEELQADAYAFAESVGGDDDWTEDEDKTRRNEELVKGVTAAQLAFQEADRPPGSHRPGPFRTPAEPGLVHPRTWRGQADRCGRHRSSRTIAPRAHARPARRGARCRPPLPPRRRCAAGRGPGSGPS